jgi:hypothetical protein
MSTTKSRKSLEDLARTGAAILDRAIGPTLLAADEGKFVAIDIESAAFEIDRDDYAAVARLKERVPSAEIWLGRVGDLAAYRMRRRS